jgi:uncharacterized C2H2 Zn-finger protein
MFVSCVHKPGLQTVEKGRAVDGRAAYRCVKCGKIWTQGKTRIRYADQRKTYQFSHSSVKIDHVANN